MEPVREALVTGAASGIGRDVAERLVEDGHSVLSADVEPDMEGPGIPYADGSVIMWGSFITAAVVFVLTALAVFVFIVKPFNVLMERRAAEEEVADPGPTEAEMLVEIRDALKSRPV